MKAKALYRNAFAIDENTGMVTLQRSLDYETLSFYQYTVIAQVRFFFHIAHWLFYIWKVKSQNNMKYKFEIST